MRATSSVTSKSAAVPVIRALGLHQIGKLRIDANLHSLYQGPKRQGPGRPKTYDGKVNWEDLTRFEKVETEDVSIVLYHQVRNHVQFQCNLRVVLVVDTKHNRKAVLFSTDVGLEALTLYRYDRNAFDNVQRVASGSRPLWVIPELRTPSL